MHALLKQADLSQKTEEEIGLSQRTYTVNPQRCSLLVSYTAVYTKQSLWILTITRYPVPALKTICNLPPMNCPLLSQKLFAPTSSHIDQFGRQRNPAANEKENMEQKV